MNHKSAEKISLRPLAQPQLPVGVICHWQGRSSQQRYKPSATSSVEEIQRSDRTAKPGLEQEAQNRKGVTQQNQSLSLPTQQARPAT